MYNDNILDSLVKAIGEEHLRGEEKTLLDQLHQKYVEMKEFIARIPKEIYYNYKYPEKYIPYPVRYIPKYGKYSEDVRNFFINSDNPELRQIVARFCEVDDDQKALMIQKWIVDSIDYVPDKKLVGLPEFWMYPSETLKTKKGDCDDGAILMANLLLASGIPYWKVRVNVGHVYAYNKKYVGKHAYTTYYCESSEKWVALDWCYEHDENVPVKDKPDYKDSVIYGNGAVRFSFNNKYSYAKSAVDPAEWEG